MRSKIYRNTQTRAKETIDRLIKKRLVTKVNGVKPPRYKLTTWAQFLGNDRDPTPLTKAQSETLEIIKAGGRLSAKQKRSHISSSACDTLNS